MRSGVLGKDIRLSGKNKEQDAWKLYGDYEDIGSRL